MFDFSEDKDMFYNFTFDVKRIKKINLENLENFRYREDFTHFFSYTFALFLIMPTSQFAKDVQCVNEKDITLYERTCILAEKYRTTSWLVEKRIKIMELYNL